MVFCVSVIIASFVFFLLAMLLSWLCLFPQQPEGGFLCFAAVSSAGYKLGFVCLIVCLFVWLFVLVSYIMQRMSDRFPGYYNLGWQSWSSWAMDALLLPLLLSKFPLRNQLLV